MFWQISIILCFDMYRYKNCFLWKLVIFNFNYSNKGMYCIQQAEHRAIFCVRVVLEWLETSSFRVQTSEKFSHFFSLHACAKCELNLFTMYFFGKIVRTIISTCLCAHQSEASFTIHVTVHVGTIPPFSLVFTLH